MKSKLSDVKAIVEAWKSGGLSDGSAMCAISLYLAGPAKIEKKDLEWANKIIEKYNGKHGHTMTKVLRHE
jgi:hypothetical protein